MLVKPLHQRAAGVQRNPQLRGVRLEQVQERQIAVAAEAGRPSTGINNAATMITPTTLDNFRARSIRSSTQTVRN